jgi:hypothetical protein
MFSGVFSVLDDIRLFRRGDFEFGGAALDLLGVRAGRVGEDFAQLLGGENVVLGGSLTTHILFYQVSTDKRARRLAPVGRPPRRAPRRATFLVDVDEVVCVADEVLDTSPNHYPGIRRERCVSDLKVHRPACVPGDVDVQPFTGDVVALD